MKITHPKDFYAGLLFFLTGLAAMVMAFEYPLGTAARMGPGYFPRVLGGIMMALGAMLSIRSFALKGEAITPFAWKAIALVLGGVCVFGAIAIQTGLVIATFALIIITGLASKEFNLKESLISSALLSVVAVLMFIVGLKLQFPIFPWGM
jgi:Tripartite tricarboxylate transporter TctB family